MEESMRPHPLPPQNKEKAVHSALLGIFPFFTFFFFKTHHILTQQLHRQNAPGAPRCLRRHPSECAVAALAAVLTRTIPLQAAAATVGGRSRHLRAAPTGWEAGTVGSFYTR